MYRHIYVAIDNSEPSTRGIDIAVRLALACGARLTGCHVYAARLHERRFQQMENGLPEKYRHPVELDRQRKVHDTLIGKGLALISDSYLDVFAARCRTAGVPYERRALEGRNFAVLLEDIAQSDCDLVVLGATGLGATDGGGLGSVCERLLRGARTDLFIVKDAGVEPGPVTVAVDGSAVAFSGLRVALGLGGDLAVPVDAVAAYDPQFHTTAFHSIAGVLSEEAGRLFHFKEQEQLHEKVIDRGLARVYQEYLGEATAIAGRAQGAALSVRLLSGKAHVTIAEHLRERSSWLLVAGRTGAHAAGGEELGATCENLVRWAACHVLLLARPRPVEDAGLAEDETSVSTTFEAAAANGPFAGPDAPVPPRPIQLDPEAAERLERVPEGFMRDAVQRRVTDLAGTRGVTLVTLPLVEEAIGLGRAAMSEAVVEGAPGCPHLAASNGGAAGLAANGTVANGAASAPGVVAEVRVASGKPQPAGSLPRAFLDWQIAERNGIFEAIERGSVPRSFAAHLPVLSTLGSGPFPIHSATKGVGLTPTDEELPALLAQLEDCLAYCEQRPWPETLGRRIAVARALYDHPERVDGTRLGMIEIFRGQTHRNILRDPRVTLLFTGGGPSYTSYQVTGTAEVLGPDDPRFRFIRSMRLLFERDRFHIQQPEYAVGYLVRVHEAVEKTPRQLHGARAGAAGDRR